MSARQCPHCQLWGGHAEDCPDAKLHEDGPTRVAQSQREQPPPRPSPRGPPHCACDAQGPCLEHSTEEDDAHDWSCECLDCAPLPSTTVRPSGPVVPVPTVQPPPRPGGVAVWPALLASGLVPPSLREACEARDALGRSRYGRPLETSNGRDAARDCLEELLDGAAYAEQAYLETGAARWRALTATLLCEAEWVARRVRP